MPRGISIKMKNVVQTKYGIYQFRKTVPAPLRAILGRTEFLYSLETKDEKEAFVKALPITKAVNEQLENARRKLNVDHNRAALRQMILEPSPDQIVRLDIARKEAIASGREAMHKLLQTTRSKIAATSKGHARSMTLTQAQNEYLADRDSKTRDEVSKRRFERSIISVINTLKAYFDGKDVFITDVSRSDARAYMSMRAKSIKINSLNTQLRTLKAVFTFGLREIESNNKNPFDGLKMQDDIAVGDRKNPFTSGEIKKIIGHLWDMPTSEIRLIGLLTAFTGCREMEIVGLDWADVKVKDKIPHIFIQPNAQRNLKTTTSKRVLPISEPLMELLKSLSPKIGPVFPGYAGQKYGAGNAGKELNRNLREIGIADPKVSWHSWRHTMKDALRNTKCDPELRLELLGHTKQGMDNIYGDGFNLKNKKEALDKAISYMFS